MKSLVIERLKRICWLRMPCLLLFLLFCTLTPGRLQAQDPNINLLEDRSSAEIQFRNTNNLILIPVLLNNIFPLEFLLDTGVRTSILTDRIYSDLLNISYDRVLSLKGAGQAEVVNAYVASDVKMLLPNVQANHQPMLVLEKDYLELGSQLGVPVNGIMGYELFARFVVKIEYDKGLITLYEPDKFKAPRRWDRLELSLENTKPFIWAEVVDAEGQVHKLKLLLDTGASHALLIHDKAEAHKVSLPQKTLYGSLGRGLLGDIRGHIGRMPQLKLAGHTFTNVLTSFPEVSSYDVTGEEDGRDGTIGGELLSRFNIIIDYPHQAVYLLRSPDYERPFVFSKTGLTFIAQGVNLEQVEIVDVRENSPGQEAGLRKHDVVLKVNGIKATGETMSSLGHVMRKRDGKKIRFSIMRDGEKMKVKFRLKEII